MRISAHAFLRTQFRLMLSKEQTLSFIRNLDSNLKRITLEEAHQYANIPSPRSRNEYYLANHPIKDEKIIAIVRDGIIVTFLTEDLNTMLPKTYIKNGRNLSCRNLNHELVFNYM